MAKQKSKKQVEEEKPAIPLDWYIPDNVPTTRVTNAVIQTSGDEFVISFFEQRGPILITEDDIEKAKRMDSAKALCVARICIGPERLESFISVFKRQFDRYIESKTTSLRSQASEPRNVLDESESMAKK